MKEIIVESNVLLISKKFKEFNESQSQVSKFSKDWRVIELSMKGW